MPSAPLLWLSSSSLQQLCLLKQLIRAINQARQTGVLVPEEIGDAMVVFLWYAEISSRDLPFLPSSHSSPHERILTTYRWFAMRQGYGRSRELVLVIALAGAQEVERQPASKLNQLVDTLLSWLGSRSRLLVGKESAVSLSAEIWQYVFVRRFR